MQIETSRFGVIEIAEDQIIHFPQGMPGFVDRKRYIPIEYKEGVPFKFLQAVDEPDLAFVITSPFHFFMDYELNLSEQDKGLLEVKRPEDVNVFVIATVGLEAKNISVNLQAPLVFNINKGLGKQIILHDSNYPTRHPLELKQTTAGAK